VLHAIYTVTETFAKPYGMLYRFLEMGPQWGYVAKHFVPVDYWNDEFNVKEDVDEELPAYAPNQPAPVVRPALVPA